MLDTTTIQRNLPKKPDEKVVTEQYIDVKSWQRVEEKTDTDEIIAYRVNSTLDKNTATQKGSMLKYLCRVTPLFYLVQLILLWCMVNGHQPLSMVYLSIILGFSFLGRNDTAMRIGIGYASIFYILVGYALDRLYERCQDGFCVPLDFTLSVAPVLFIAVIWGTLAGLGFNPSACAGIAIINMAETHERRSSAFDLVFPGTSDTFSMRTWPDSGVLLFWLLITISALLGFILSSKITSKTAAILLRPLLGFLPLVGQFVNGLRFQLTFVFPPTVLACYFIAVNTLPLGRALLPEQKPVGLEKLDLFDNLLRGHLPAIIFGVAAGTFMLGGKIVVDSVNDCFVVFAILVLVSFLTKLSPLSQYFLSTPPTQTPDQDFFKI